MHHTSSAAAQIPQKIHEVVRLLRKEAREHAAEHWGAALGRICRQTGVHVNLREGPRISRGTMDAQMPHGNTLLATALSGCWVIVADSILADRWSIEFNLPDWDLGDDKAVCSETTRPPDPESVGPQPDTVIPPHSGVPAGNPKETGHESIEKPDPAACPRREVTATAPVYNEAYLIREFDRRERDRGPIFAGFIVNDLMGSVGFAPPDAKRILRAMEAQDMVRSERKQSPKNPDRMTTFFTLNREHPKVAKVLGRTGERERRFPIGTIKGEPLSEQIIRERG